MALNRHRTRRLAAALLCTATLLAGAPAGAACRQALALALDVSSSVNAREYALQVQGLAAALGDAELRAAILSAPSAPVWLAIYEWSGQADQFLILDWTPIDSEAALNAVAARLAGWTRRAATETTALGKAMLYGASLLARAPDCWQHTLDVSGDGKNNDGPDPESATAGGAMAGVIVNGLVIGADLTGGDDLRQADIGELEAYYRAHVIRGPGAFVETALGYHDYARAMRTKLRRELAILAVSQRREAPVRRPR